MRKYLILTVVAAVSLGVYSVFGVIASLSAGERGLSDVSGSEDTIIWISSYARALNEAKRTGKPIFLEFRCVP